MNVGRIVNKSAVGAAIFGLCMLSSVSTAQDANRQSNRNERQRNTQEKAESNDRANNRTAQLPKALRDLDLKDDQKQQLRQTMQQHNKKLQQTWQKFNQQHMEAVELEAAWAAAVRDTLNEEDQRKFDEKRDADQKENPSNASHREQAATESSSAIDSSKSEVEERDLRQARKSKQEQISKARRAQNSADERIVQTSGEKQADRHQNESNEHQNDEESVLIVTVLSPVRYIEHANQSAEQEHQCSEVCQKYSDQLTNVWKQVHELHAELVQIEADRIASMEKILTEEQLMQLKKNRTEPESEDRHQASTD